MVTKSLQIPDRHTNKNMQKVKYVGRQIIFYSMSFPGFRIW